MSDESFRLADEHLGQAKEIAGRHSKRGSCRACYGRGWTGVAQDNTIVLCHKCVDPEAAFGDWKTYVAGIPALKAHYRELFEEDGATDAPAEGEAVATGTKAAPRKKAGAATAGERSVAPGSARGRSGRTGA